MEWWWAYLLTGTAVGFLAGLLGIGGGMVMVPALVFIFTAKGFPVAHMMHLALATGITTIAFTSVASVRAHHRHGAVDWPIARAMSPGIVAGSFAAALGAGLIATRPLAIFFTAFMFFAATQMLFQRQPKSTRALPGPAGVFIAGAVIGGFSSLLAAGGAFLSIPFLAWCNVPLRRAIGTAAANGFPIALAGSAGYVIQGLRVDGLPAGSLGFVYLPALVLIVATSMLVAPWGARLAHRLPITRLRTVFAIMLYALGARMLATLW
ncbi:MAG: sulfite exporter TauE/SafE family protein [Betaproteobacteria bacterium]|nr:MAG: sulfite exporter TauE/SafE family protein [Betaproteobacteria bacterium]